MPAHLRLADVGVLPSRAEAISLAGLEMMAIGLPLVGSRVGGIPEFLDETAGRLVPPDDPGALAAAILDLLARPRAERAALGATGRTRVLETYSWQAAAHQTLSVYTRAIGDRLRAK
jgi:glycosyltransferase involved in cell wall biosynthesis